MVRREKLFLGSSRCILVVSPCDFERLCLQHAAKECLRKSLKICQKTDENGPKWLPKPLQNRPWRGSGGLLGGTLETRCFQDIIFDDFGSILGPPLGPVWAHFGHRFFDVFLKCLFEGFGLHLGSQNTSKMRPKRDPRPEHENHWFCWRLHTLATFRGAENGICSMCFWNRVLGSLLEPILVILAHFWGPFWSPFW